MSDDTAQTIADNGQFLRHIFMASVVAATLLCLLAMAGRLPLLAHMFLIRQDLPLLLALAAAAALSLPWIGRLRGRGGLPKIERRHVVAIALAVGLICLAGFYLVLWGRDFSRDEQLAIFDARTFAAGHWVGIMPGDWVELRRALNPVFMEADLAGSFWASDYRPVNSMLHAIFASLGAAHVTGPMFAALALYLCWRCAKLLWPDDNDAGVVTVVMLALSAQFLVTGMTAYAMTPLLALNMGWLLLVWRGDWRGHAGALAIGFFATGLHQVLYHPLFAFPVAAMLLVQRRWTLAALYAVAYLGFILFWESFSGLRADWAGYVPALAQSGGAPAAAGAGGLWDKAAGLVGRFDAAWFSVQAANLVRLIAWQHLLFLPLLIAGFVRARRTRDEKLIVLVAIVVFAIVVKTVLRPYQGHGWGYRYLHGALGAMILLCAAGWIELRERGLASPGLFKALSLATLLAILPLRLVQAHQFSGAYARPSAAAMQSGADVVIVDDTAAPFAQDIVINDPFVRNRPVLLLASQLDAAQLAQLCSAYDISTVDAPMLADINALFGPTASRRDVPAADQAIATARLCASRE